MKWNSVIIAVLALIVIVAAALALIYMTSPEQSGPGEDSGAVALPTAVPPPVKADVLDKFGILKEKINASGQSYAGAAIQLINDEETAMVYIYKPSGLDDVSSLLASGFDALYSTFETKTRCWSESSIPRRRSIPSSSRWTSMRWSDP
jgi:hypothetical protein